MKILITVGIYPPDIGGPASFVPKIANLYTDHGHEVTVICLTNTHYEDEEKYKVVDDMVKEVQKLQKENTKIDGQLISEVLTVNGIRFSLKDGSWGLIRASSNKPSLVVVTESPTSDVRKKKIFEFIDNLLQKTGKVGEYDQKI